MSGQEQVRLLKEFGGDSFGIEDEIKYHHGSRDFPVRKVKHG